jgi:broad specificity phosphatase PhoE
MKKVYFVRHGEAEGNALRISQDIHTPLTQKGHEQARVMSLRVSQIGIEKIYTSHMTRSIQTGQHIAEKLNLEPLQNSLFGEWMTPESVRGKSYDSEAYSKWREELKINHTNVNWRYEDAENFSDLEQRLQKATELLELDEASTILVVSHEKFLKMLLPFILLGKKLTPEVHLQTEGAVKTDNTGITLFEIEERKWSLITWNDRAHFADN